MALVPTRVLVVEDDRSIAEPLVDALVREGFEAEAAGTLADARASFGVSRPDLVLLDLMLPDGNGRDLFAEMRSTSDVPVIIVTARGEEVDRVVGLELGADDYVVKPFSARELVARIRAVLRRAAPGGGGGTIRIGRVELDPEARLVTKDGEPVALAAREFDLLRLLMENAGRVLRREEIMDEVWDPHWFGPTKTLDVHISWLRKKLEDDAAEPRYITTVRRVGFRFAAAAEVEG